MIKIGLMGIAAVFCAMLLKKDKNEFAVAVIIAAGILIFIYVVAQVSAVAEFIEKMFAKLPIDNTYLVRLFKILGITYVAEFSAAICQDAGYSSVAGQIELFAKITILVISIPGLAYVMDILESFV